MSIVGTVRPNACFWQACQVRFANVVGGPRVRRKQIKEYGLKFILAEY